MLFPLPENKDEKKSDGGSMQEGSKSATPVAYKLDETVRLLVPGTTVHWVSEGDWSMHDLLLALLEISGPAEIYLSSYAFSEYPARLIADQVQRKKIKKLYCLIDKRLDVRSASALTIIRNVATRLELINTHAKTTVIESKDVIITVVGSANYTTNKRYESGIITMDREAGIFHKKWMANALEKNK